MEQYWLIYDGTGSVEGGTGGYLVVLGQWEAAMVGTWWYWVIKGQYWAVLSFILENCCKICSFLLGDFYFYCW